MEIHRLGNAWIGLGIILALCVSLCPSPAFSKETSTAAEGEVKPNDAPKLGHVFSDDFSKDTRKHYQITGEANWEPGRLTLTEAASIEWHINGGAWAKVELKLNAADIPADGASSELRVWIVLNGATNCFVRLRMLVADGGAGTGSVALFDTGQKDGRLTARLVREQPLQQSCIEDLSIEYRHGLVEVSMAEQTLLMAHIANGAAGVDGCRIEAGDGIHIMTGWSASGLEPPAKLSTDQNDALRIALELNAKVFQLWRAGRSKQAIPVAEEALRIRRQILGEVHPDTANSLFNLAAQHEALGDSERAEPLYKRALAIQRTVLGAQHPGYATSLNNLATLYQKMADYARAEPLHQQAADIWKSVLGDKHPLYAASLNNRASFYQSTGDYTRAEVLYKQTIRIRESILGKEHRDYATSLNNLAALYIKTGDFTRAEALLRESLDLRRTLLGEQHPHYGISLISLGELYRETGDYARAEPLFKQASEIWKSVLGDQHPHYATSLNSLAGLYDSMGDYVRAELHLKHASRILQSVLGERHPQYARILNNLAGLYNKSRDYARAEQLYRQSVDIVRKNLNRSSLVQSERQQSHNQSSVRLYLDDRLANSVQAQAHTDASLYDLWQWKGAVTTRQRAYRQVAATPSLVPLFSELQSISQRLSSISGQIPLPPVNTAVEAAHAAYRQKKEIWRQQFSVLSEQREELERQIAADSGEFRRIREPLTVESVQHWLPQGAAYADFLEYRHGSPNPQQKGKTDYERRYVAFVVRKDGPPAIIGLGSAAALGEAITSFRRPFLTSENTAENRKAAANAAQQIRRDLWLPIEKHLDSIDTVIISPDAVLGTLPFAALPGKTDGRYLLEDYRLAMIPMAGQLRERFASKSESAQPANSGLLVLGDVDYDAAAGSPKSAAPAPLLLANTGGRREARQLRSGHAQLWDALPGFRKELDSIRTLFAQQQPDQSASVLSGDRANETAFLTQAPHYRTLHLITHGYFEDPGVKSIDQADVRPEGLASRTQGPDPFVNTYLPGLLSGLAMAGANNPSTDPDDPHDGILRASEIEASSLQGVDLVVLSACETGLGAVAGGEGLTGLQRAFQVAGARTVIASLWKVDDDATLTLMTEFYTNLWEKKMSKLDALREAQLTMLRGYDPKSGQLTRSLGGKSIKVDPSKLPVEKTSNGRLDPRYWAAFQLSGDWQ